MRARQFQKNLSQSWKFFDGWLGEYQKAYLWSPSWYEHETAKETKMICQTRRKSFCLFYVIFCVSYIWFMGYRVRGFFSFFGSIFPLRPRLVYEVYGFLKLLVHWITVVNVSTFVLLHFCTTIAKDTRLILNLCFVWGIYTYNPIFLFLFYSLYVRVGI